MTKFLVEEEGADISAKNDNNHTAMDLSFKCINQEIAEYLITQGAEIPPKPVGIIEVPSLHSVRAGSMFNHDIKTDLALVQSLNNFRTRIKLYKKLINTKLEQLFQGNNFNNDLINEGITPNHIIVFANKKIQTLPRDFKETPELFAKHINDLYSLQEFLEINSYFRDDELKTNLEEALNNYTGIRNFKDAGLGCNLKLKTLCMLSLIKDATYEDISFLPQTLKTELTKKYLPEIIYPTKTLKDISWSQYSWSEIAKILLCSSKTLLNLFWVYSPPLAA